MHSLPSVTWILMTFPLAVTSLGSWQVWSSRMIGYATVPRRGNPLPSTSVDLTTDGKHDNESVSIEYCTGCRWMMRSAWMAQELLTTFQDELDSVTLIPSRPPAPGGVFTVRRNEQVLWDRKTDGGFPESKELKQRVRDKIAPERFLGHSDTTMNMEKGIPSTVPTENCQECNDSVPVPASITVPAAAEQQNDRTRIPPPNVSITYCTGCRWLLRAAWLAQELLTTFDSELNSVTLIPSRPPSKGGTFTVALDGKLLWDRTTQGRFPEPKEVKQLIRDSVAPDRDLGHSDVQSNGDEQSGFERMDDDEAAEMRKLFGVM